MSSLETRIHHLLRRAIYLYTSYSRVTTPLLHTLMIGLIHMTLIHTKDEKPETNGEVGAIAVGERAARGRS